MHTTSLRKVGGSVMMAVPPALLELLDLQVGTVVGIGIDGKNLVIHPQSKTRYTLEELLAECDAGAPLTSEDRAWIDMNSVGHEL